ncbi:HAD hydrolase-like protein [Candidatus Mycosynbacter amalyticus]|uniref:HAD hydrolase-like protein n=1 Tax=Candidatus Mycosynbacter amalyticus TaxID=2665156 RepID=A0A857MJ35_9BACT|nr:HAD hydrolase-like protein [Candidatus Mycosynbacter amalyticus]QHN42584.1 HAD hydrolase-like protein [Candidatus Mycosynbacter amalyticus]
MNTPVTPSSTDTFYIVDFDRTLVDSDKLLQVFIEITNQYILLPIERVQKIDADVKAKGDSFDTASYVRDHLADQDSLDLWERLQKQFIHESRALNMLLPGANELLAYLNRTHKSHGILTYGNPLWQHLKLTASGFNHVHRIVTTDKHKGRLISGWQQSDGSFHLPPEFGGRAVERVVLIDDKSASYDGFPPEPSHGYQPLDYATALPAQLGDVPRNVTHVTSLHQVIDLLE